MCSAPWYAARSELRSASTAGATESTPARSSCAAGRSRPDSRATLTTVALASIDARTAGRWKGSFASGKARRTSGMIAIASSRRAGPRSNGRSISAARKRLRAEATFSSPSSVRIAHAQALGPCTRTPFASAIPPSRIFSSAIAQSVAVRSGSRAEEVVRGVAQPIDSELQVLDRHPLVRRVNQPCRDLDVHHPRREEPVGDRTERLAKPVAVGEARDTDRNCAPAWVDPLHERLDRVPQWGLERRARAPVRLQHLELVVVVSQDPAHDLLRLAGRL